MENLMQKIERFTQQLEASGINDDRSAQLASNFRELVPELRMWIHHVEARFQSIEHRYFAGPDAGRVPARLEQAIHAPLEGYEEDVDSHNTILATSSPEIEEPINRQQVDELRSSSLGPAEPNSRQQTEASEPSMRGPVEPINHQEVEASEPSRLGPVEHTSQRGISEEERESASWDEACQHWWQAVDGAAESRYWLIHHNFHNNRAGSAYFMLFLHRGDRQLHHADPDRASRLREEMHFRGFTDILEARNPVVRKHGAFIWGICLLHGLGGEVNAEEAMIWLEISANLGHRHAQDAVRELSATGRGGT